MTSRDPELLRFARELHRRRTFRTAGVYVVGAWLVMHAADVLFPGWRLRDSRWAALADNPRFTVLIERVKADVDHQRMQVERVDAVEDFPALLDQVRTARRESR